MTLDAAKPKHRYVALDSLRGVCACLVVLYHFGSSAHFASLHMIRNGYLFVDFFFVLSGFVIATSYGQRLADGFPIGKFMWLRLWRVYPLHVCVLLLFFLFEILFAFVAPGAAGRRPFEGGYSIDVLLYTLFLVQIFFGTNGAPWNGPSWSIAAEVWTYLIFALAMRFASRWILPLCLLIAAIAPIILFNLTDRYINVFHEGALLRCLFGFSLGIVGWLAMPHVERLSLGSRTMESAFEIAMVVLVVAFASYWGSGPTSLAAPFVFFLSVMTFARERGVVSGLLRTAPFVLAGTLSYSIYMIHLFFLYRFVNVLSVVEKLTGLDVVRTSSNTGVNSVGGGPWLGDILGLLFLATIFVLAYLSYRWIELPGQRKGRELLQRRAAGAAARAS